MVKISSVKCNRTKYCKYICTRAELKIIPYLYSVIHFNPLQVCGFSGDPETIVGDEKEQTSQLLIKLFNTNIIISLRLQRPITP